jgi:flagellar basal body rod protein FlgG
MHALYTAKLGLQAQQQRINIIGSNIANSQTVAYKSQRADFKDALYTAMINPADTGSTENLQQGCGTLISSSPRSFTQGQPEMTGYALDFYIDGDGFFTITDGSGGVQYTRSGDFAVSGEADSAYLVTPSGQYVMDINMNRIKLPADISTIELSPEGVLSANDTVLGTLNLVDFPNKDGLLLLGGGNYIESASSGAAIKTNAIVRQGVLEASNVDLTVETTRLIRAQRAFSLASRALTSWNDMTEKVYNLR